MISVFGSNFGEEEVLAVSDVIRSQWVGIGKKVKTFEEKLATFLNQDDVVLVDSGSNALFMAVSLLDLPSNSEIIVPSFTWVACAQAIVMAGHKPVFCDVDKHTQNVTIDTILPKITNNTKAIMVVHYAGKPVDMLPIMELGLPIIEDAAHAIDASYKGQACGTIGDIGIYSFDAVKNLAIGEGGGLVTKDINKMQLAKKMRYCGIGKSGFQQASDQAKKNWWEYNIGKAFIKMLPTDLEASIGIVQLDKLQQNQKRRKEIWDRYQEEFKNIGWLVCPSEASGNEKHGYFTYFIQAPKRNELANYLLKNDIYTTLRYHPLHLNEVYGSTEKLPISEHLNQVGLNIPLHPRLTDDDVSIIIDKIKSFSI